MYSCSVCGKAVTVLPGVIIRTCKCKGPILAHANATMKGAGGVRTR